MKPIRPNLSEKSIPSGIRRMLVILTFLCTVFPVIAQVNVTGTITDESNQPLPGVSITIKGTTQGAISDMNGMFSINANEGQILVFSFIGYKDQSIEVSASSTNLSIVMEEELIELVEVVAIGYGTVRRADVTSAVATVKAEDFTPGKIQDAGELIKGKVAGLSITKSSGDPNASSTMLLRGISSIKGSFKPLVLIDGIPGDLTTVAPENIESIDVLKDASAAAIYGTRGANGVIIITTKSGKRQQQMQASYTAYTSVSGFMKEAEFMTVDDIIQGKTAFPFSGYETDWVQAVTRKGLTQNHSLNLSGGTESTAYAGNVSYRNERGTIINTDNEEVKMQLDLKHYAFNDKLKFNLNILKGLHGNSANNAGETDPRNVYRQAVIRNPSSPIYNEDGSYNEDFNRFQYYNPVALLNELTGEERKEWTSLTGNITLEPVDNWETNLMLATHRSNATKSIYTTKNYYSNVKDTVDYAYKSYKSTLTDMLEMTTRYELTVLSNHRISAMAGYSYTFESYDGFSANNKDFPNASYSYNNLGAGSYLSEGKVGADMDSYKNDNRLIAFFGRLTYNYSNKYNLMASLRHEGSSKFGEDHRWGWFPSISTAWIISNESFMSNVTWLENLKLRAGYGVTGIFPNESYQSLFIYEYDTKYGNYLDENGKWLPGLQVKQNFNPYLHWEKSSEVNFGIDYNILKGRIYGAIDVYNKETNGLLYDYTVPLPPNLFAKTLANVGSVRNRGIEVMISGVPFQNDKFEWNTTLTFSHNNNKLLDLSNDLYDSENYINMGYAGDPITVPTHRIEVGQSFGNFWGLRSVGVTEDGIWLIEDPEKDTILEYSTSLNTDRYRQYLGNGIPDLYLGWSNTFIYGNLDLTVQMSGQFGFEILNEQRMFYENNSIQYNKLVTADDPVYGVTPLSTAQAQAFVSYYLEKGNFVKFDNITLGYTLNLKERARYISSFRFYVSGQNLFCITKYSGLDPELTYDGMDKTKPDDDLEYLGNDPRDKYPTIRSFTLGLNVNF